MRDLFIFLSVFMGSAVQGIYSVEKIRKKLCLSC